MTVKELLTQIQPTLETHECATLYGKGTATKLVIEVIYDHDVHIVGKYSANGRITSYDILKPFNDVSIHTVSIHTAKDVKVLDLVVYRWGLQGNETNDRLWRIEIEARE